MADEVVGLNRNYAFFLKINERTIADQQA